MKKPKKKTVKKQSKKITSKKPNQNSNAKKQKDRKTFSKSSAKEVRKRPKKKSRVSRSESKAKVSSGKQLRQKKSTSKNVDRRKVSVPAQRREKDSGKSKRPSKTTGKSTQRISGRLEVSKQTKNTGKQLDFTFSRVKKIDNKIALFKKSAGEAVKKQLKKFGGKPPRGIVVTFADKSGVERTFVSRFDFVVNENSTINFVADALNELKDNYETYKESEGNTDSDLLEAGSKGKYDSEAQGYELDWKPDGIVSIRIRFIYEGKKL